MRSAPVSKVRTGGGLGARAATAHTGAFFPCFDGLRAIAALLVIGVHTSFASGFDGRHPALRPYTSRLEIGVEVFFVISGFLLYRPFAVAHFGGRPAPAFRDFWLRRLRRIIPAYWVAFLVVSYVMHGDMVRHTWDAPLIYLGFAQIYLPRYELTGLTQSWSLCIEMSFYLMIPLYGALLGRRKRSAGGQLRAELWGLAALVVISFAYRIPVLSAHGKLAGAMPSWLPGYIDQFALGMFLAVVSTWLASQKREPGWLWHPAVPYMSWALAAVALVAVSNLGLPWKPVTPSPVGVSLLRQTLYGAFGFFMVLPAVFGRQDRTIPRRLLRVKPLALIGVVSYGVYLWHEAWMQMFFNWTGDRLFTVPWPDMVLAVTALAVMSATASYLVVERPILRWRRRPRVRIEQASEAPELRPVGATP